MRTAFLSCQPEGCDLTPKVPHPKPTLQTVHGITHIYIYIRLIDSESLLKAPAERPLSAQARWACWVPSPQAVPIKEGFEQHSGTAEASQKTSGLAG